MSQLHFIVREIQTGIKEKTVAISQVEAYVALPEIAIDKARLELLTIPLPQ